MEKRKQKLKVSPLKAKKIAEENPNLLKSEEELVELYKKLKSEEEHLDREIVELENQGINTDLKPQMEALHEYNEMKDAAQAVLGYIADIEQITIAEVHKRYNVPTD